MKPSKRKIENRRAISEAIRKTATAKNALKRLVMGVEHPDTYLKYANALGVLQCLPTIIDNYLTDFESIGKDSLFVNEKALDRQLRVTNAELERLLQLVYKMQLNSFSTSTGDKETAKRWCWEQSDLASEFCRHIDFLFTFCCDTQDKWRIEEINGTLDRIATADARTLKYDMVRERTDEHLKSFGLKSVEEAKERIKSLEDDLAKLQEAQKKGLDVVYAPSPQTPNQNI